MVVVRRLGAVLDDASLTTFGGQHLTGFETQRVECVDRLPRNAANKMMIGELGALRVGVIIREP